MTRNGKWCLEGFSVVENRPYPLRGECDNEADALDAARLRLAHLERFQPTESSGGQDDDGIQDRIFIVRPDGSRYRFVEVMIED